MFSFDANFSLNLFFILLQASGLLNVDFASMNFNEVQSDYIYKPKLNLVKLNNAKYKENRENLKGKGYM